MIYTQTEVINTVKIMFAKIPTLMSEGILFVLHCLDVGKVEDKNSTMTKVVRQHSLRFS